MSRDHDIRCIELMLERRLGGRDAPDLSAAIFGRAARADCGAGILPASSKDVQAASPHHTTASRLWRVPAVWLAAASVVAGVVLMVLPGENRPATPPPVEPGVKALAHAGLRRAPDAKLEWKENDAVRLVAGTVLMEKDSPALLTGVGRVEQSGGRVLVRAQGAPDSGEARALGEWLASEGIELDDKEKDMLLNTKRWMTRGAIALCVLSGSVMIDGAAVDAQMAESPPAGATDGPAGDGGASSSGGASDSPAGGPSGPAQPNQEFDGFKQLREWTGASSAITVAEYHMIAAKAEWAKLWERHAPGSAAPEVDFTKHVVVAIFAGQRASGGGIEIDSVMSCSKGGMDYVVRYGVAGDVKTPKGLLCPYGFFEFNAPVGSVIIEEGTGVADGARRTIWHERARPTPTATDRKGGISMSDIAPPSVARQWTGADSGILMAEQHMIRDNATFMAMWNRHRPQRPDGFQEPAPGIDFSKEIVVAIFAGTSVTAQGIDVADTRGQHNAPLLTRRDMGGYIEEIRGPGQWNCVLQLAYKAYSGDAPAAEHSVYGIFVLPRGLKRDTLTLSVESPRKEALVHEVPTPEQPKPVWEEIVRFMVQPE